MQALAQSEEKTDNSKKGENGELTSYVIRRRRNYSRIYNYPYNFDYTNSPNRSPNG